MRTHRNSPVVRLSFLVILLALFQAASAQGQAIVIMQGDITGVVNGIPVNFDVEIVLDTTTGEETAEIRNMPPVLGAVLRPVTAMVTVGGPTGGMPIDGAPSLLDLSNGNYTNDATVFWPDLPDTIRLVHTVTRAAPDLLTFTATMNGTAPQISINDAVEIDDFSELLRAGGGQPGGAQTILSGPGQRPYRVGGVPFPPCPPFPCGSGTGKGSITVYQGPAPPYDIIRSARDLSTTYDSATQTMTVHLFNALRPAQIRHNGILVSRTGEALLEGGDRLTVSNIGSSGEDGVSIDLGPDSQGAELEWLPLPPEATGLTLESTGTLNGNPGTLLGSTSLDLQVDSFFDVTYDFSSIGSPTARVEFYANGQHVETIEGASGIVARAPQLAHDCGKGGERIPRPIPLPYPWPPFPFPFPPFPWPPIPCYIWGWDTLQNFQIPSTGGVITADEIRILTENPNISLDSIQNLTLRGTSAPDSFFDIFTDLGECRYRAVHRGLGQAHLESSGDRLIVSNIGSSGEDGVSIDLGDTEIGRGFEWLPLPPLPPGSTLETQAFGTRAGGPEEFLGSLCVGRVGNQLEVRADYSPLGSTQVDLLFFSGGQQVHSEPGVPATQPIIAQTQESPGGCGKVYPDPTILCFYWNWPFPIPWLIPGLPVPILADQIVVLASNPSSPFDKIDRLTVQGTNLPSDIQITSENNSLLGSPSTWGQAFSLGQANIQPETSAHPGGLTISNIGSSGLDGVSFQLPPGTDTFATFFAPLGTFNDHRDGVMTLGATGRLQGDTSDRFLGSVNLEANISVGCIDIFTDYASLGASGVRFQAYDDGVLVADQSLADGVPILRIPRWPDGCGKEPVPLPFPWPLCIWIDPGDDIPIELLGPGGNKIGSVTADTFRLLAENPDGALAGLTSWDLTLANIPSLIVGAAGTGIHITSAPAETPTRTELYDAVPNPFNPRTEISFALSRTGKVKLDVYDLSGRHVTTLHEGVLPAGRQSFTWNGTDIHGKAVASGVYAIKLDSPDGSYSEKVTLVK